MPRKNSTSKKAAKINRYNHRVEIDGVVFDSRFEYKLITQTKLANAGYHDLKLGYMVEEERTYNPDFIVKGRVKTYLVEAKGRFNFREDLKKYLSIQKYLYKNPQLRMELVFVFENPKTPIPGAKERNDGTKLSNGEWATKEGFRWCTIDTVDSFICEVTNLEITSTK